MSIIANPVPPYVYPIGYYDVTYYQIEDPLKVINFDPSISSGTLLSYTILNTSNNPTPNPLPPGLVLNNVSIDSIILEFSGAPTAIGTYTFRVRVVAENVTEIFGDYTITIVNSITASTNPPNYTFPEGTQGLDYNPLNIPQKRLSYAGTPGSGLLVIAVLLNSFGVPDETALPPGINFTNNFPGSSGTLIFTGTPTSTGTYTFGIKIISENTSASFLTYTMKINPLCVASDTEILMADNTLKKIQHIKRGDLVASDPNITNIYKVSNINIDTIKEDTILDLVTIEPNSIDHFIPHKKMIMTPGHPIIIKNERRPARLFTSLPGIQMIENMPVKKILPLEENGIYHLWDLQFDTVGSYVANGITVQSRHPQSFLTPLEKELYFDKSLYSNVPKNDHDSAYKFPLVQNEYIK